MSQPLFGNYPRSERAQGRAWCAVAGVRYWRTVGSGSVRAWAEPEMRRVAESAPSLPRLLMRLAARHGVPVSAIVFDPDKPRSMEELKREARDYERL